MKLKKVESSLSKRIAILLFSQIWDNKIYHNFEQFSEAINKFFSNISNYKDRLRALINDNFQTITVNHFCNSSG